MATQSYPVERDEILIPTNTGYKLFPLSLLLGLNHTKLGGRAGFGMAPLRFLESSSPYQHGVSVSGMRWQTRVLQIIIQATQDDLDRYWNEREEFMELFRPTRSFITEDKIVQPFIYRKWLPGGKTIRGNDMIVQNGSDDVLSNSGRFLHTGGLGPGNAIYIDGVKYQIADVPNDFEIQLTVPYAGSTSTAETFSYFQIPRYREIFFIPEAGPTFEEEQRRMIPYGWSEVLRLRAHDPFWRGVTQQREFVLPESTGDLVFDGEGAWFGVAGFTGRWVFQPDYVSDTITLVYHGHDIARPIIYLAGPASFPSITNLTTGISLNLAYELVAGELVVMDIDALSITNNFGDNLLGYLRGNFSGFGLVPEPAANQGRNLITVTFGGATQASSVRIEWQNVYAGI